jgi:predicted chitinase
MTPPRPVLLSWRALEAAERVHAEFDRRLGDLEALSAKVRTECHRLDGDGWRGAAFDAVLSAVEAAHHHNRMLCDRVEGLRDAGVRALSDLHYTALALLDYASDAEAHGCTVADDWAVTGDSTVADEWAEVIGEAATAVDRAEQRGRQAIMSAGRELRHLVMAFGHDLVGRLPDTRSAGLSAAGGTDDPAAQGNRPDHPAVPSVPGYAVDGTQVTAGPAVTDGPGAGERGLPAADAAPSTGSSTVAASDSGVGQNFPQAPTVEGEICPAAADVIPFTEGGVVGHVESGGPAEHNPGAVAPASVRDQLPAIPHGSDVSAEQLVAIMPNLPMDQARQYAPALNAAMREGNITTSGRRAAFLSQLAHESCEFRYLEELGDDHYFHQYDPGQPNAAAGNTQPGDGPRYHGRGPIQLTGRANYRAAGQALGLDLEGDPGLAARPDIGFRIAQWYWTSRNINALADAGDFAAVTRAVNGGYNGLESRETYHRRALEVLG